MGLPTRLVPSAASRCDQIVVGMTWEWSALVSAFQIIHRDPSAAVKVRGSMLPHVWQMTGAGPGVKGPKGLSEVALPMHCEFTPSGLFRFTSRVVNHMT